MSHPQAVLRHRVFVTWAMAGGFGNVILGMQSLRCDTKYCAANEQPHPAFTQARRQLILSIA